MRGRFVLILATLAIVFPIRVSNRSEHRGRVYAFETAALKAIQTLNTAQVQYNSAFGRFATSLTELGPSDGGTSHASAADLISGHLASGEKLGYKYTLTGTPGGYAITAVPSAFGLTGSRTFFSDQSLVIRENYGQEPATAHSREVGTAASKRSQRW